MTSKLMAKAWLTFFFLFLVCPAEVWSQTQPKGNLAKLSQVKVLVQELSQEAKDAELTDEDLKTHALSILKSKLPKLLVSDTANEFIAIRINFGKLSRPGGEKPDYFSGVDVELWRLVRIRSTGKDTVAMVWGDGHILKGPLPKALTSIRDSLTILLSELADDWMADNPESIR